MTWFRGTTAITVTLSTSRRSGEKLTVINIVNIEDYVQGCHPYEMSGSPCPKKEALKAPGALCQDLCSQPLQFQLLLWF